MKERIARWSKSTFIRNILVVMTGSAVAQVIGFALSPLIGRLFSPTDFGIFGSFGAVLGVIGTITTLQYSQAIILPKEDADAINLLGLSCVSTAAVALLCLLVSAIVPGTMNGLMETTGWWALVFLAVATLVSGVNQSFQAWCVRRKEFKHTSASQVVRSVASNGLQLGGGGLGIGAAGLVASSVVADVLATWNLGRIVLRDWRKLGHEFNWARVRRLAAEYSDFPTYNATSALIQALSLGLPMLLLTRFYGLAVAGAYAFSMRILSTPMGFILTALKQVLLQKAAETHHAGRPLTPLYLKITFGLFGLALLPCLALAIWAPPLFSWVFGARWLLAGEFSSSLVIWLLFMFCNVPAALFGRIIRIQRQMFLFDVSVLVLRTASLYWGGQYLSPGQTILFFACVGAFLNIVFIATVGYKLRNAEQGNKKIEFTEGLK